MIVVADVETTGDNPERDQICELGLVFIEHDVMPWRQSTFDALCGITVPMDPRARASHHIDPALLAGLPTATMHLQLSWPAQPQVMAAHMASFDASFLAIALRPIEYGLGVALLPPLVCTYRCAMHLWPDAPAYGLQVLRYWLNLDVGPLPPGQHQHRALYDALVCAALLRRMLTLRTLNELIVLTTAPVLQSTIRFGKHRGEEWGKVPMSYLKWVEGEGLRVEGSEKGFDPDTHHTAKHWLTLHEANFQAERKAREQRQAAAAAAHLAALQEQEKKHAVSQEVETPGTGQAT